MKILRRVVRSAFFVSALTFVGFVVGLVKHPEFAALHGEARYYVALTSNALLAVLYGAAYLTTWRPSPYRNNWAVAASSLSLMFSLFLAVVVYRAMPGDLRPETPVLIIILVSAGGLYFYVPGGSRPKPESAAQHSARARSIQPVSPAVSRPARTIPTTATAVAPSLAAASSPELAAAAASPGDPNAPWDPLAFVRTPESLQKFRGESQ
jgi:hypothetical protein